MIALWIYLGVAFLWACLAVYMNMTRYSIKPSFLLNVVTFAVNLIIFPVALIIAIVNKKFKKKL